MIGLVKHTVPISEQGETIKSVLNVPISEQGETIKSVLNENTLQQHSCFSTDEQPEIRFFSIGD